MPGSLYHVWSISPLLLKVGIPKSICGCILGCKVLCTIFRATLTLTSILSRPRIIVSLAYLSKLLVWMHYSVVDCSVLFWGHYDLNLCLWSFKIICGAYFLYYMAYKPHILDTCWGSGMLNTVLGHRDLDHMPQNLKTSYPQHISHIFRWMHQVVGDCSVLLWANVTLTSGLSCIKIVYWAYLLNYRT